MQSRDGELKHNRQTVDIELAEEANLEAILALQKLAYLSEAQRYNDFDLPPLRQTPDEIQADFARMVFFKATSGERIVGSVRGYAKDGTCYVGRLIVHPDVQGARHRYALDATLEQHFITVRRSEAVHRSQKATGRCTFTTHSAIANSAPGYGNDTVVFLEKL